MSAVPSMKSHFASSNVTTPGFAVGGANNNSGTAAHANGTNSPSIVPAATANFFTNASSSYQSHFGDFSSGGVNIARSTSNTSAASAGVGVVGGGVPPSAVGTAVQSPHSLPVKSAGLTSAVNPNNNNSSNNTAAAAAATASAPIPIGTAPSAVNAAGGSKGSLCTAPMPISGSRSSPSSHNNSPHTLSITPTAKFASPMAVGTSPKTTSTLAASAAESKDVAVAAAEARKAPTTAHATTTNNNGTTINTNNLSCNLAPISATSPTVKPAVKATSSNVAAAQADLDEDVLSDAHKYAMFALSTASETGGGGMGGVSLSPTSPCAPHSGTPSPTSTTPRVDLTALSPTSSTQLSAQHMQQQQQQPMYSAAAPLTPLSAQSSSSRHSNPSSREPVVNVYDSDFKTLLSIPASQVVHRPHPSLGVSRLVLCRNYSPENPSNCSKGELCKFVHADVSTASRCTIHVNYAWRSLDVCTYPRLPAGDTLTVLAPNERPPAEVIASERILVTRGSTNWREHTAPLSHCAHYYFNRMCNRGERCNFIHAVHVDPNVQGDFKRAPAPTAVAPIVAKSPTSPALRAASNTANTTANAPSSATGSQTNTAAMLPPPPPPPPLPPQQPPPPCSAFGFAPNVYTPPPPPPPPGAMGGYPLTTSPTGASGPYMMFSNNGGATGFVPATLVPPPPSHLGNSNGVYLLVPAHAGMSGAGGTTPVSPVSPLGQSLGSLSNGPIDWSFYGDLETSAWMPPSPSGRIG